MSAGDLTPFGPLTTDVTVGLNFARPSFDWARVPVKFFEVVYGALAPHYALRSRDFSVLPADNYGAVSATYTLFGGNSTITLQPDKLVAQFPSLKPSDSQIVADIMSRVHDEFMNTFEDIPVASFEYREYGHHELFGIDINSYLARLVAPNLNDRAAENGLQMTGGLHLSLVADNNLSSTSLHFERSLLSPAALFAAIEIRSTELKRVTYQQKSELVADLISRALATVGLKPKSEQS